MTTSLCAWIGTDYYATIRDGYARRGQTDGAIEIFGVQHAMSKFGLCALIGLFVPVAIAGCSKSAPTQEAPAVTEAQSTRHATEPASGPVAKTPIATPPTTPTTPVTPPATPAPPATPPATPPSTGPETPKNLKDKRSASPSKPPASLSKRCGREAHPGIWFDGDFAYDRGCAWKVIYVDGKAYKNFDKAVQKAMLSMGWKTAPPDEKPKIARVLVSQILTRVKRYRIVHSTSEAEFSKIFYKPKVELKGGGAIIRFWRDTTRIGMRRPVESTYVETIVTVDKAGKLVDFQSGKQHSEPF